MNMMIVGSGVGNAPAPSSVSSTHSATVVSMAGTAAVGQPPPAHLTQLTSSPVIGQSISTTAIPISLRTTVEHTSRISHVGAEPQPAHGSPGNARFSAHSVAISGNVISQAVLPSHSHAQAAFAYGSTSQQLPQQVLTHLSNSSSLGSQGGGHGTVSGGMSPFGHSLPPPCQRPVSHRPHQSPTNRSMTNGLQTRTTPPSRSSNLPGRHLSSGTSRSYSSSRMAPTGGGLSGSTNSPAQHHMSPGPQSREASYSPRNLPQSPQRSNSRQRPQSASRPQHGGGYSSPGVGGLPPLGPSVAHQLVTSNVNSPSLIPQMVPQFMPHLGGLHMNAGPSSPQYRMGSPLPSDNNSIFPPHEIKKITKAAIGHDDELEGGHEAHHTTGRRSLMSPRNAQRRSFFSNAALQDHNYCAVPPPSPLPPPRSPTPPLSPYISVPANSMGASAQSQPSSHQDQHHQHAQHHQHQQHPHESFSFGIAGYKESAAVLKDAAAASSAGLDKHPIHHQYGGGNPHYPHHNQLSQQLPASSTGGVPHGGPHHHYPGAPPPAASAPGVPGKETGNSMIGGYPSPHYSGGGHHVGDASPLSRLNKAIEDAGVGPMTPLGHERSSLHGDKCMDADDSPDSRPSPDRDGGEETETAPEEDPADDAITRCICDFLHDDGYMICCDKCSVWQHVVCMFVDKDNIPEEYLCEKCQSRPVDKKRAKALQKAREKEIFKTLPIDSSDDDERNKMGPTMPHKGRKTSGPLVSSKKPSLAAVTAGSGLKKGSLSSGLGGGAEKKVEKKLTKKPVKRRTLKETLPGLKVDRKSSPRKNQRRKSASATDIETEEENVNDATALRSWIDTYEEAVTNHYSPELRARLQGVKVPTTPFKPKDTNHSSRYNVSLRGNGVKVLTANSYIPANTPIIECRGKYMLASQLHSRVRNSEFVLFHRISSELEVCVDCKTYGNDSRFCRRTESDATKFNAEVKHTLDKGSLHLYIVSTRTIDKNQEILLCPLERKVHVPPEPQLSIQDELRQIKKVNGLIEEKKPRKVSNAKQQRRMKREVKKEMCDSSSDEDLPVRKTRSNNVDKQAAVEKSVNFNLSTTIPSSAPSLKKEVKEEPVKEEKENKVGSVKVEEKKKSVKLETLESKADKVKEPLKIEIKEEEKYSPEKEIKASPVSAAVTPTTPATRSDNSAATTPTSAAAAAAAAEAAQAAGKSPSKQTLGLPDQTGLIVGVNTINYDVSLRNKSMSREEKKMEMILKAIAAMEKAETRKKHESGGAGDSGERAPAKRRRSNSSKKEHADSNIESSCDETGLDTRADRPKAPKGKRKRTISLRRRSRAKSGDSTSAMSADESATTPNLDIESSGTPGDGAPFKFPLRKQHDGDDVDDDVSGHYIRGSKSPPGIANHLLRSAVTNHAGIKSPTKSIGCSAKKRWLRAAMSEDHAEEAANTAASSSSPALAPSSSPALAFACTSPSQEPDYTPLKKRRLATYNESHEDHGRKPEMEHREEKSSKEQVTEKIKSLPNGLKKRLISNLLLNAVLDKAMEDILPGDDTDGAASSAGSPQQQQSSDEPLVAPPPPPVQSTAEEEEPPTTAVSGSGSPSKKKTRNIRKGGAKNKKSEETVEENGFGEETHNTTDASLAPDAPHDLDHDKEAEKEDNNEPTTGDKKPESQNNIVSEAKIPDVSASSNLVQVDKARSTEEKPPTPIQHSVFKSFFSTDLSIDDIDRQIEAKRIELARENSLASSSPSPRLDFSDDLPRTLRTDKHWAGSGSQSGDTTPNSKSMNNTPSTTRKKVSIADYKKRKQAHVHGENQIDSGSLGSSVSSVMNTLLSSSKLNTLPPVSLPDLPGLAPVSKNKTAKTGGTLFEPKRTRSNSPLHEKRNSVERKGLTPQESRMRSGSPLDKKSPAKGGRDRTSSPRRGGVTNSFHSSQKQERWESKSSKNRDSHKGKPSSPLHTSKRVPVPSSGVEAVVVPDYPSPVTPRPPIHTPDMPREDLTERLRKEFGLNIEDSEGEDGSDSEGSGGAGGGSGNGGSVGSEYPALRRHNGPERTNGWREEEKGGFWGQR